MGQLFWKYFSAILLAQCLATAVLGGAFCPIVFGLVASLLLAPMLARCESGTRGRAPDPMSLQLRAMIENQQQLLSDVAHELNAPLARLRAALGLAQQQPEKQARWMRCIEREGVRMEKLVDELLTFSRLNGATDSPLAEDVAVLDLIEGIVADAMLNDTSSRRRVCISGCPRATVRGSPELLSRAIDNVVRNAIKYGPALGKVEIELHAVDSSVVIRVLDDGPGVAAEHLSAIFQPFFRSRANPSSIDGHGLGLSIAMRAVAAHGGSIKADNRVSGGLCVTLTLPVR